MNGLHGIIFAYEKAPGLRELTEARMPGSVPFGGRYRVVDFMLSNMAGAGITDVGVVLHGNYQSLLDHIGSGKTWDMARKNGGLKLLPPFADARKFGVEEFRGKMEALSGGRTCTRSGRSTSSCPTATLSSICRCRRCWTRTSKAARTSPASAPRAASLWKTPRISPSTKRAASPRRAARRTRRVAAAAWRSTF